jgi:hypothetical protein
MHGMATAWPTTCVTPAANGAPRWCTGPVDWRHLAGLLATNVTGKLSPS